MGDIIKFGCGSIVGLFIVTPVTLIILLCAIGGTAHQPQTPQQKAASDARWNAQLAEVGAAQAVKTYVTNSLKAPSTARFESFSDWNIREETPGVYVVASHVDSQNGFGAMIRTRFRAQVVKTKTGWWKLEKFEKN